MPHRSCTSASDTRCFYVLLASTMCARMYVHVCHMSAGVSNLLEVPMNTTVQLHMAPAWRAYAWRHLASPGQLSTGRSVKICEEFIQSHASNHSAAIYHGICPLAETTKHPALRGGCSEPLRQGPGDTGYVCPLPSYDVACVICRAFYLLDSTKSRYPLSIETPWQIGSTPSRKYTARRVTLSTPMVHMVPHAVACGTVNFISQPLQCAGERP